MTQEIASLALVVDTSQMTAASTAIDKATSAATRLAEAGAAATASIDKSQMALGVQMAAITRRYETQAKDYTRFWTDALAKVDAESARSAQERASISNIQQSRDIEMWKMRGAAFAEAEKARTVAAKAESEARQRQEAIEQSRDIEMWKMRANAAKVSQQQQFASSPAGIFQAAGLEDPLVTRAKVASLTAAHGELNRQLAVGDITSKEYNRSMNALSAAMNTATEGNARHRNALRQTAAAMASVAFEAAGAIFLLTTLGRIAIQPAVVGGKYLKDMEDLQLGMSGVILSAGQINGRMLTWAEATQVADTQMKKLQATSMYMAGTTQDLAHAFQSIATQGLSAGMTIDQVSTIAIEGVAAGRALGIQSTTLSRDLRDLVLGIRPNSTILAASLGVTKADIDKARTSAGGLFEYIDGKMKAFLVASGEYNKTFTGMWEQLSEMFSRTFAESSKDIFAASKQSMQDMMNVLGKIDPKTHLFTVDPDVKATLDAVFTILEGILRVVTKVVSVLWSMRSAITILAEIKLGLVAWGMLQTVVEASTAAVIRWGVATAATSTAATGLSAAIGADAAAFAYLELGVTKAKTAITAFVSANAVLLAITAVSVAVYELADSFHQATKGWDEFLAKIKTSSFQALIDQRQTEIVNVVVMKRSVFSKFYERDIRLGEDHVRMLDTQIAKMKEVADISGQVSGATPAGTESKYSPVMERLRLEMEASDEASTKEITNVAKVELAWNKLNVEAFKHLALADRARETAAYTAAQKLAPVLDDKAAALAVETENKATEKSIEALQRKTFEINNTKEALAKYDAQQLQNEIDRLKISTRYMNDSKEKTADLERITLLEKKQFAEVDLAQAEAAKVDRERWTKLADSMESVFKKGLTSILDGSKSVWIGMRDSFRSIFIDFIYEFFAKKFTLNIIAGLAGMGGFTGLANAAGTQAAQAGLASGGGLFGTAATVAGVNGATATAAGTSGLITTSTGALTTTGIVGAVAVGGMLLAKYGFGWGNEKQYGDTRLVGNFNKQGFQGNYQQDWTLDGGLFGSNSSGTVITALTKAQSNTFKMQVDSLQYTFNNLGTAIGDMTVGSRAWNVEMNESGDITATLAEGMANQLLPALKQFQLAGETLADTAKRLTTVFQSTNALIAVLGTNQQAAFGSYGISSATGRSALINAVGGSGETDPAKAAAANAQAFSAAYSSFTALLTPAQQLAAPLDQVARTFSQLGVTGVETNAQFTDLVKKELEAAQTTGDYTRVAALLNVSDAFGKVTSSAQATTTQLAAMVNQNSFKTLVEYVHALRLASTATGGAGVSVSAATTTGGAGVSVSAATAAYASTTQPAEQEGNIAAAIKAKADAMAAMEAAGAVTVLYGRSGSHTAAWADGKPWFYDIPQVAAYEEAKKYYESLPSMAVGTNYLPSDMVIQAHEGERVIPKADNRELMSRLRDPGAANEALVAEIRALRSEVSSLRSQLGNIESNTRTVAIISDKWDGEGTPEVRTL